MRIQLKRSPVFVAACGAVAASAAFGVPAAHAQSGSITNVIYTSQDAAPAGPDARKACDATDSNTSCHIFAVNLAGAGGPITSGSANDLDPAASPDGTKIAFARRVGPLETGNYDIYVMSANGQGIIQLTSGPRDERYPAWSPDGSRIAYRGYPTPCAPVVPPACDPDPGSQIFTMGAGGPANSGTAIRNTAGGDQPTWSPNGAEIAYSARPAGPGASEDIFRQSVDNAAGAPPTQLTSGPQNDRYPSWQPTANSKEILFRRLDTATDRELWRVDSETAVAQALLAPATNSIGRAATWSPLNLGRPNVLAFVSYAQAGTPVEGDQEIWLGSLSGNTIGNLPDASVPLTNNDRNDDEPRISHVPATLSPVTRPTGVAGGGSGAGGAGSAGGIASSLPLTVGGGTTAGGKKALSLTLTVPKQNLGKKKKTVRASVKCSAKCIVTMTGFTKLKVGGKTKTLRLQRINKTLKAGATTRINVRLPLATLRSVRRALRAKKRVTFTISAAARTTAGEFTPAAKRKLVLRR